MNDMHIIMAEKSIANVFKELKFWIDRAMPKDGEIWKKEPCVNGMCRIGWSLGAGEHIINKESGMDYDAVYAIKCGCLKRISE